MFALGMALFVLGLAVGFANPPVLLFAGLGFWLCLKSHQDSIQRMMGFLFVLAGIGGVIQIFIA